MALSELQGDVVAAKLWIPREEVEASALEQMRNAASLPWARHVLAMPDIHAGHGVAVGSVVALRGAVAPNIVGVDIGCGMTAMRTGLTEDRLPAYLSGLRAAIEAAIPAGAGRAHETPVERPFWVADKDWDSLWADISRAECRCSVDTVRRQLGTLGSGNHFIEVCVEDRDGSVWLMLHSGSRNFGKQVCDSWAARAAELPHNRGLSDPALAVFLEGTPEFDGYWRDMEAAQRYAEVNRGVMLALLDQALRREPAGPTRVARAPFSCCHNYATLEEHFGEQLVVARKGAIRVGGGRGIIPGAMGRKSYIVRGLDNAEALFSASHGAGRRMSRGQATRTFTVEDLREQLRGVECHIGPGVLDEAPGAYKDLDTVMRHQADLVSVEHELRSVLTVKGHDDGRRQRPKAASVGANAGA